jgi:integration host factor subunit beta
MTKQKLIDSLAGRDGLTRAEAGQVVGHFFQAIIEALTQGGRVEVRGFGSFTVRKYQAYKGRNPKTGAVVKVKSKKLPYFKVGKELKERVSPHLVPTPHPDRLTWSGRSGSGGDYLHFSGRK